MAHNHNRRKQAISLIEAACCFAAP